MIQQIQYGNGVSFQLCDYLPLQNEKTTFWLYQHTQEK